MTVYLGYALMTCSWIFAGTYLHNDIILIGAGLLTLLYIGGHNERKI